MPPAEDPRCNIQDPTSKIQRRSKSQIPSSIWGALGSRGGDGFFRTRCFPGTSFWRLDPLSLPCFDDSAHDLDSGSNLRHRTIARLFEVTLSLEQEVTCSVEIIGVD